MSELDDIARRVRQELAPDYEARLRAALADRDADWLRDELVRLLVERDLGVRIAAPQPSPADQAELNRRRDEREARVAALAVDEAFVRRFVEEHRPLADGAGRDTLVRPGAPIKGSAALGPEHRTPAGEQVLTQAKDVLFALLFGDASTATRLERTQQELLTLALPRHKADTLDFLRASTELAAAGTWQDPESVSNDERADNVLLEVQFGEVGSELVGSAVMVALQVINELEVNEQVLYVRMINVEETSL